MRKNELVSSVTQLVLRQHSTQDSLKVAHPRVIEAEISKAYSSLMKMFYANEVNLINADLDFYAKKFTATIQTDGDDISYVSLPVRVLQLKNNLGIRYVKAAKGTTNFVRVRETELETIKNLDSYCCTKNIYYYLDGTRIVIDKTTAEQDIIEDVVMKLLPVFDDFEDEDNIEFPEGDYSAMQLILKVMGYRQTDNINDDVR